MRGIGIQVDENNELKINPKRDVQGRIMAGLVVGETTLQNTKFIIAAEPGTIKWDPLMGVGVQSFIDDEHPDNLLRTIRTQLALDGQEVSSLKLNADGTIVINAKYKE